MNKLYLSAILETLELIFLSKLSSVMSDNESFSFKYDKTLSDLFV